MEKNSGTGITFVGALTIAFIVLKLLKVIEWSWLWVLSPIWISALGVLAVFLICMLVVLVKALKR